MKANFNVVLTKVVLTICSAAFIGCGSVKSPASKALDDGTSVTVSSGLMSTNQRKINNLPPVGFDYLIKQSLGGGQVRCLANTSNDVDAQLVLQWKECSTQNVSAITWHFTKFIDKVNVTNNGKKLQLLEPGSKYGYRLSLVDDDNVFEQLISGQIVKGKNVMGADINVDALFFQRIYQPYSNPGFRHCLAKGTDALAAQHPSAGAGIELASGIHIAIDMESYHANCATISLEAAADLN